MDLKQLKEQIYAYVTGTNDFDTAIDGEFFYIKNPKDSPTYPYGVYQFLPGESDADTGTDYEKVVVQITIYDDDSSSADLSTLGGKFDTLFDNCEGSLALDDYYVHSVERISPPREIDTPLGNYQWSADYEIYLEKK